MNTPVDFYKALRIRSITEDVPNFKTIVFEEGHGISYKPGQYLTFVEREYGNEIRRSYSITSTPILNEPLAIGVKRVENGFFSRLLIDRAKPGDELVTIGSGGFFTLPNDISGYQQIFFFAAGGGITPIYSLLKTVLYGHSSLSAVLVYSNASPETTVYFSQLQALSAAFPQRFHLEFLFSNEKELSRARLNRERIHFFVKQYVHDGSKTLFYLCGPENYMRLCAVSLTDEGIALTNIRKENFYVGGPAVRDALPPSKDNYTATIHTAKKDYQFVVPYPDSILKAARKSGIALPYSCEAGRCGSCVALCTKGSVWHSYNEVLTDAELSQGLVLTCVGHPNGVDVELKI